MYQTDEKCTEREALDGWMAIGGGLGEVCRGPMEAQRQHAGGNEEDLPMGSREYEFSGPAGEIQCRWLVS